MLGGNPIFYFMTFLSIHYCIYRYKKTGSNPYIY